MATSASHHCGDVSLHVLTWSHPAPAQQSPVVLLPGTGLTAGDWEPVAAELSRTRVVHAVDLRGHGASDWPGSYSLELMAGDVARLLPQLGSRVDLVGHSLGGLVACLVASASAEVGRLVLEDVGLPRPRIPTTPERPPGRLAFDWAVVEQVRPEIDTPAVWWPEVVRSLAVPVLAVSGGPTSFVPVEWVEDLVAAVPDGAMVTVDAGHEVHANRPAAFLDAVLGFLTVEPAPRPVRRRPRRGSGGSRP